MNRFVAILCCLFLFASCNPVTKVKNLLFGEEKKEKKELVSKKERRKREVPVNEEGRPPLPDKKEAMPAPPPEGGEDQGAAPLAAEPATPESPEGGEAEKGGEEAPKSAAKPAKEGPLSPGDHFAGEPTCLTSGNGFVYAGFGRKLVLYDPSLAVKGSVVLEKESLEVSSQQNADELLVFVKEDQNILEIIRKVKDSPPEIVKSFQAEGPFDFSSAAGRIFVYLPERVQALDVSQATEAKILFEVPVPGVSQATSVDDTLYLVRDQALNVVDASTLSVLASVPLGAPFRIIGSYKDNTDQILVVAFGGKASGPFKSIQLIKLAPGGKGVADLGQAVEFKKEVRRLILDPSLSYVYLAREGEGAFYDLKGKTEIPISVVSLGPIKLIGGEGKALLAAGASGLGRFEYEISSASPSPPAGGGAPLATPSGGFSLKWTKETVIPLAGSVKMFVLYKGGSLLVVNDLAGDDGSLPPLFFSKSFPADTASLTPLSMAPKEPFRFSIVRATDQGLLLFEQTKKKIYQVASDLSGVTSLSLPPLTLTDFDAHVVKGNLLVFLAGTNSLLIYSGPSGSALKKVGEVAFKELNSVKAYDGGKRALAACGEEGVCLLAQRSEPNQWVVSSKISPSVKGAKATAVSVSPNEKSATVYYEPPGGPPYIALLDLGEPGPREMGSFQNISASRGQFMGLTYSAGGQKLIVPTDTGVAVFDVRNSRNPRLSFEWPVGKAYFTDVTNRGLTLCAALGPRGVECGRFE